MYNYPQTQNLACPKEQFFDLYNKNNLNAVHHDYYDQIISDLDAIFDRVHGGRAARYSQPH